MVCFDLDLTDIFAVQDELTREIVTALKLKLTAADQSRLVREHAVSVEAYELLLRASERISSHDRDGNAAARRLAAAALAIDSAFGAAHALISFTHVLDYVNDWSDDPESSLRIGRELAQQVVKMAEQEPYAHLALGMACMWSRELHHANQRRSGALPLRPTPLSS